MDRFEDMRAFVAVVESGSFTAAADRLDLAKSAVSRRVGALEERLGVQLFRRTTRRVNLTDTGRSFYERGARILADLDEAESAAAQEHGTLRGRLRVALPLTFGVRHMCAPIAEFSRRHPGVDFDLDLNDRRVDLVEEGVDLAIRIAHLRDSSLIARRLFEARTVMVASRAYLDTQGSPEKIEDLADHRCLVYGNLDEPSKWACTDERGSRHSFDVPVAMTATSGDFLCSAAAEGMGLALLPTFVAGEFIRRGELLPVLTGYEWPVTPAYAVYAPTRHLSYRVRAFIDFLAGHFSGVLEWDANCRAIT